MNLKTSHAAIEAYGLLKSIPEPWRTPKVEARLIAALNSGDGEVVNVQAGEAFLRDICDEYSSLPGEPAAFDGAAWEKCRRSNGRPPIGESLLSFPPGAAGDADLERATARLADTLA